MGGGWEGGSSRGCDDCVCVMCGCLRERERVCVLFYTPPLKLRFSDKKKTTVSVVRV